MARDEADVTRFLATDGADAGRGLGAHAAARLWANPRDRLRGGALLRDPGDERERRNPCFVRSSYALFAMIKLPAGRGNAFRRGARFIKLKKCSQIRS